MWLMIPPYSVLFRYFFCTLGFHGGDSMATIKGKSTGSPVWVEVHKEELLPSDEQAQS